MNNFETDKTEIERLLTKSDIKSANGLDCTDELMQALALMSKHMSDKDQMNEYRKHHKELALSVLGEQLSDIPMGRVIQFQSTFEKELDRFKKTYARYRDGIVPIEFVVAEYEVFCAVVECLDHELDEASENDEYEIPGLQDEDVFINCVTVDADETDINKYYESLEYIFRCFDCLNKYARKIIEENTRTLMSVLSFELGLHNVYTNGLMEFFREQSKNASDT